MVVMIANHNKENAGLGVAITIYNLLRKGWAKKHLLRKGVAKNNLLEKGWAKIRH